MCVFEILSRREGEGMKERDLLCVNSFPKYLEQTGPGQSEARSREIYPGLPWGCRAQGLGSSSAVLPGILAGS